MYYCFYSFFTYRLIQQQVKKVYCSWLVGYSYYYYVPPPYLVAVLH
jgi:hypothetical protein